jgi:hypothetical protein
MYRFLGSCSSSRSHFPTSETERESHGAFKGALGTGSFSEETWTYSLSEAVLISRARRRSRRSFSLETGSGVEDWFAPMLKEFPGYLGTEDDAEVEAE